MSDMSDERGDLIMSLLRAIRADTSEIKADISEIRRRVGLVEMGYATMQQRMDRLVGDIEQIKRRLELVDAE